MPSGIKRTLYFFAIVTAADLPRGSLLLSHEHDAACWPPIDEAVRLAKYSEMEALLREAHAHANALAIGGGDVPKLEPPWEMQFTKSAALLLAICPPPWPPRAAELPAGEETGWVPSSALLRLLRLLQPDLTYGRDDAVELASRCAPLFRGGPNFEQLGGGASRASDAPWRLTPAGFAAAATLAAGLGPAQAAAAAECAAVRASLLSSDVSTSAAVASSSRPAVLPCDEAVARPH